MTPKVEYWVMRVLTDEDGPVTLDRCTPASTIAINSLCMLGHMAILPDRTIAEPVEVFEAEALAHKHRAELVREYPREDFRVVMNADMA